MTTATMKYNNPIPSLFLVLCLFLIIFSVLSGGMVSEKYVVETQELSVSEIRIIEVVSGHAWNGHGAEVNSAFNCLGKNGTARAFKTSGFVDKLGNPIPTNLWMCFDGNSWYAVVTTVFQKLGEDKVARLVTAYKIATDLFPTIEDYVNHIVNKWNAFEIKDVIEAGEIFLKPK